jgi:hypothetical protein
MKRWQQVVLGGLVVLGAGLVALRFGAPGQYDRLASEGERLVTDVPAPAVVAAVWLVVVAIFIASAIYAAKFLYWSWRQIDRYVLWVVDRVFPESPVVRFGVGLIIMVLLFLIGPLLVLQAVDFFDQQDPVEQAANDSGNESPDGNSDSTDGGTNDTTADSTAESDDPGDGSTEGDPPEENTTEANATGPSDATNATPNTTAMG